MDTATLLFEMSFLALITSILFSILAYSHDRNGDVLYLMLGNWVYLAGTILFNILFYHSLPFLNGIISALFTLAYVLGLEGLCRFRQQRGYLKLGLGLTGIDLILVFFIELQGSPEGWQILINSIIWIIILGLWIKCILIPEAVKMRKNLFTLALFTFGNICFYLFRIFSSPQFALFPVLEDQTSITIIVLETTVFKICCALCLSSLIIRRAQFDLEEIAHHDYLTGILNRRFFIEQASRELAHCRRKHAACAFLLIDLDHFKEINDLHGHQAGDAALVSFSRVIADQLRTHDLFGRLGGEEFGILLPEIDLKQAIEVANRLRCKLAEASLKAYTKERFLTMSIGAVCSPANGEDIDTLINVADKSLYHAKLMGRDRCETP